MPEKILSQEEVDALLKGVSDGKVSTQPAAGPTQGVRSYDFSIRDPIPHGGMSVLEFVHERFARFFQAALSSAVRREIQVQPMPTQVISFEEFMKDIPLPICLNLVKMEPLKGQVLVLLKSDTLYILLQLLFGGSGQGSGKIALTEFTPIEQRVIHRMVGLVLDEFQKAWSPLYPFKPSLTRSETNPQFTKVMSPGERVIRISFKMQIEEEAREILLALPYRSMEPVFEKLVGGLDGTAREVDPEWAARLRSGVTDCGVSVMAELGTAVLTIQQITQLAVGDVIVLEKRVDEELEMKVEGRSKFRGHPGLYRGKPAFQITSLVY
ncbi:MAG: flagellar motor switch protein FliM [Candidatus Manganitrophaceae bacterium]|nr:MAG: flagellar motor switch protein FliM [Candidatus Manganitrophaceae bacterium]